MKKLKTAIALLSLLFVSASQATPILELGETGNVHRIELLSSNVFDGTYYKWTYKVTSADGNPTKALSHWVIDICADYYGYATDPGGTNIEEKFTSADPNLGIFGLKFDDEYADGEMRTVVIYMEKELEVVAAQVGIKSGGNLYYGFIDAPSCECAPDSAPEPSTLALIAAGAIGLTAKRRKLV